MKINNKSKQFKLSSLALCISGLYFGGTSSLIAAENQAQEDVEVIEVRGIRRSLEASINTKRFANSVVDAITSEDIGKFPDKNIGDALQRVAGVTVDAIVDKLRIVYQKYEETK